MALSDEWQSFRRSGSPSLSKRLYRSSGAPLLGVVNANRERLVAIIADASSMPTLGLDLEPKDGTTRASLVDEHGKALLGRTPDAAEFRAVRSLSGAGVPWQLSLAASSEDADTLLRGRRNFTIAALGIFMVLVGGACYAIARGALREAAAGRLQARFRLGCLPRVPEPADRAADSSRSCWPMAASQDEGRRRLLLRCFAQTGNITPAPTRGDPAGLRAAWTPDAARTSSSRSTSRTSCDDGIEDYQQAGSANGHAIEADFSQEPLIVDADPRSDAAARCAIWWTTR